MKYKNTITGAIVDVESKIHGNWEPLVEEAPVVSVEKVEPKKRKRKGEESHE